VDLPDGELNSDGMTVDIVETATLPLIILGTAAGKRVQAMQAARLQLGLPPARIVEWRDWLENPSLLDRELESLCLFKIESPGDDSDVQYRLLQHGCDLLQRAAPQRLAFGELRDTDAWYAGLAVALSRVKMQLAARSHVQTFNDPDEILLMTDKLVCQHHLLGQLVPIPLVLGTIQNYAHLRTLMKDFDLDRVYLKSRYGSSAAGVLAYRRGRKGREQVTTSAQLVHTGGKASLYNVKRLRQYEKRQDIVQVIELLAGQQAYAEAWIPKPRIGNGHYDVRALTLAGQPAHCVARIGALTITNLHLDNQRGDTSKLLDAADQLALEKIVRQAAASFPRSHVIGFDLVVRHGEAHILEANAFGDLLPGLLWQGHDTYSAQLQTFTAT
jgi:hypothetical protein